MGFQATGASAECSLRRVDVAIRIQTPAVAPSVRGRRMETQAVQLVDGEIDAPVRLRKGCSGLRLV